MNTKVRVKNQNANLQHDSFYTAVKYVCTLSDYFLVAGVISLVINTIAPAVAW